MRSSTPDDNNPITPSSSTTGQETDSLLGNKKEGWLSLALKGTAVRGLAAIAALPNFINASLSALHIKAKDVSVDAIQDASAGKQMLAGTLGISAVVANTWVNLHYIPTAFATLFRKENWAKHPIRSGFSLIGGLAGAFSLTAIAIESAIAFPVLAGILAASGFAGLFATRFSSVYNAQTRLASVFNDLAGNFTKNSKADNVKIQEDFIKTLDSISDKLRFEINQAISTLTDNASPEDLENRKKDPKAFYESLFKCVYDKFEEFKNNHPNDILDLQKLNEESKKILYAHHAATAFKMTSFVFGGFYAYLMFAQKGLDFIDIVDGWVTSRDMPVTTEWSDLEKILISIPFGAPSAVTYALNAHDFLGYLMASAQALSQNPKQIPLAGFVLAMCAFSASSMYNIATIVADRSLSLFSPIISLNSNTYVFTLAGLAGGVNLNAAQSIAILNKPEIHNPTDKDVIQFFAHAYGPNGHKVSKETRRACPRLFSNSQKRIMPATDLEAGKWDDKNYGTLSPKK